MTRTKTMLALVLCAVMVFACGSVSMAKDSKDVVISKVNSLGIMIGTNKGFEEDKTLTRAEATAIIVRMAGYTEKELDKFTGITSFTDVEKDYWGAKYINVASEQNLVKGIGDELFAPDREVTVAEFVTMAVRSLGAEAYVEPLAKWPANYVNFAKDEEIISGKVNTSAVATRMDAAEIVANTLETEMWKKTSIKTTGEVGYERGTKTLLEEVFEVEVLEDAEVKSIDRIKEEIKLDKDTYEYACALGTLVKGAKVDAWVKDEKVIRFEIVDDCDYVAFTGISKVDTKEKEVTLIVDGEEKVFEYDSKVIPTEDIKASGIATIEDDEIVKIEKVTYSLYTVSKVTSKRVALNGKTLTIDDKHFYEVIDEDGKSIEISDLEKDDVVLVSNSTNHEYTVKVVEQVTGKIAATGKDYVKIGSVKYIVEKGLNKPALKSKVTAYVFNDRIIGYKDAKISTDFARIIAEELVDDDDYKAVYTVILNGGSVVELNSEKLYDLDFYSMDIEDEEIAKATKLEVERIDGKVTDLDDDEIEINGVSYDFEDDYFVIDKDNEVIDLDEVEVDETTARIYVVDGKVICVKY